jgi:hypothetical protein
MNADKVGHLIEMLKGEGDWNKLFALHDDGNLYLWCV